MVSLNFVFLANCKRGLQTILQQKSKELADALVEEWKWHLMGQEKAL